MHAIQLCYVCACFLNAIAILLYGHESLATTKILASRIQTADMKVIRLMNWIERRDKIRNAGTPYCIIV